MAEHLVVIHGFNSTSNSFNFILDQLKRSDSVGLVTCVNYQSHNSLCDVLKEVEIQLPKDGELVLVGHSLGGIISVLLAHKFPTRISRVITISSPIGGSKAAFFMGLLPGSPALFRDITPSSPYIKLAQQRPPVPLYSIVTLGGNLKISGEPNDSVVTVSSQRASPAPKNQQVQVRANHFEVLLMPRTIQLIKKFMKVDKT